MQPRWMVLAAVILLSITSVHPARATCLPNSAVLHLRVFNDCPTSVLTTTNLFPGSININDENPVAPFCAGFANMHTWRFSADGVNPIEFSNGQTFEYSATLTLNGVGEGGLSLSPWWSPDADGLFNVRTTDGEIACFGGRMPFFSFTAAFGLTYVNNTPIQLGISYFPNGLSAASPAAVVYNVRYMGTNYTSGLLNFDEGNPAENPPHGLWGALTPWFAGGHVKMFVQTIGQPHGMNATWNDIQYLCGPEVSVPTLQCPPNAELACGESTDPSHTGTATATGGDCSTPSTISHTDAATPANCTGHAGIDRTWSASDACGNTETCVQHITFKDTNAPVIHATGTPADGVLGCNPTAAQIDAALGSATASDDCGDVTPVPSDGAVVTTDCGRSQTRTWTASDGCGNPATPVSRTATWTVDPVGATISGVTATPASLWPPNHTMRDVTIDYTVNGACSGAVNTSLSVSSNEPINGTGDGDTSPDWEIVDNHHLRLRAERAGTGSGRVYTVTITATDGCGKGSTATVAVVVAHNINAPVSGAAFKINTPVNFAGTFWDVPGSRHTAQWMFNTLSAPGTVTEPSGLKSGSVSGTYSFPVPGVYKVMLNLTDPSGVKSWVNTAGDLEAIVVAYDPTAGFTTGGGWFQSPAGACPSNPSAVGKVSYGFTSKYFKNASNPKGATQFEFKLGGLAFSSLNYSYLAISGARAQFKGFGQLNGDASYYFILTVIDGQLAGGGGTDRIRVKIWNKNTGAVAYDSQMGASDAADPTLAVGSGSSITIVTTTAVASAALEAGSIDSAPAALPESFSLTAIRPNPFSRSTEIQYSLPTAARVVMTLYSVTGQRVREILNDDQPAGYRSARVDAGGVAPGIYLVKMRATSLGDPSRKFTQVRKVVLE